MTVNGILFKLRKRNKTWVKQKNPMQPLRPITKNARIPMYQSKLKADTCGRRKGRENVRERVTICFSLTSDWMTTTRDYYFFADFWLDDKVARILFFAMRVALWGDQYQSKCELLLTLSRKPRYQRKTRQYCRNVCDTHVLLSSEGKEPR